MTFPSGLSASTQNLDSSTDNPSLARSDLYDAVTYLNAIIDSENQTDGVVVLNNVGKLDSEMIPNTVAVTGNIMLEPTEQVVGIKNVMRLYPLTIDELDTLGDTTVFTIGDTCIISDAVDGAGTGPAIAFFDGTDWKFMLFSGLTTL